MLNRKNIIFCILVVLVVVAGGSLIAWKVINNNSNSANDVVSSIETQSSGDNIISAIENQTSEDAQDTDDTGDSQIIDLCVDMIGNLTGYETEEYIGNASYVSFSGIADADSFWNVTITLKNGNSYGLNVEQVGVENVITDLFYLDNGSNNQKLVLTTEMQDYMDDFNDKIDNYFSQFQSSNDYSDSDYESNYEYYYHIIYNGTDNDLSYQKVKLSGLGDYLGIDEQNAKDSYTQEELEEMLDAIEEQISDDLEDYDVYQNSADDVWELTDEMTEKISDYVSDRSKDFIDNPEYDKYVEKALEVFKSAYSDKVSDKITANAYIDIIVNGQKCIVVQINANTDYWIAFAEEDMEIMRFSLNSDLLDSIDQTQVY